MSKEELLVTLLKSYQSLVELQKRKSNNVKIEETRKVFNELRNRFSKKGIIEIRKVFYEKEKIDKYFKELERENNVKNEEKKVGKYQEEQEKKYQEEQEKKQHIKGLEKKECFKKDQKVFFKDLRKYLDTIKKRRNRDSDDPDYEGIRGIENLFNKIDEDYYKPVKTKGAFNDNYIEYECRGDKDKNLSLEEYFDMIRPYLRDIKRSFRQNN